jgi:hypothetical protein
VPRTARCKDYGNRACVGPPPDSTFENVCDLGVQCNLMPINECVDSCRAGEMTEAQRTCLIAAGLRCDARGWEACLG